MNNINISTEINNEEEYIEIDFTLNVDHIQGVVLDLKKNNIIDGYTLQEYFNLLINILNSLKNQKKREVKSFSDTCIGRKTKKHKKFGNFKDEIMYLMSTTSTINDSKEKLSSWSLFKKKLLKNELKLNDGRMMNHKFQNIKSHSSTLLTPINGGRKEKFLKCWPSEYDKLLVYVKNEMNLLFEIHNDYNELIERMKVFKNKKEMCKKNVNTYKLLIPPTIRNEYFGTANKKLQLSYIYDKLGFSQKTNENIKNFLKYDELMEYIKFHLLKLELQFHQYEMRIIRLFVKLNVMHKELLELKK
uniref:PRESAN domain-containing protein n=1 Tax=Strongyloides stercoralis TaxID=6248 RepID=A0A0K0EKS1_STRER